ncbi:MAG TPA: helix-turn-helix transcriptional regulator [Armatimonadota bacterium]|nr:helix-turn-helix transcriptional regulator [Armatimonadota bacterium]
MSDMHGAFGRTVQAMMGDRSHVELAERAGVSSSYLNSVLRGNIPSRPVVLALARACDLGREGASHLLRLAGYPTLQDHEWAVRKPSSAMPDSDFSLPEPDASGSVWLALEGPRGDLTPERGELPPLVLEQGSLLDDPGQSHLSVPLFPQLTEGESG